MKPMVKPNRWSCTATAFAMALDIDVKDFFRLLGHDGSEIVAEGHPDPIGRRGIHIQECIYVAMRQGRHVTPVELVPQIRTAVGTELPVFYLGSVTNNWKRFETYLGKTRGVLTGVNQSGQFGHAFAYERGVLFDPDSGDAFPYSQPGMSIRGIVPQCLWIVT